jgi:hypothetical protein
MTLWRCRGRSEVLGGEMRYNDHGEKEEGKKKVVSHERGEQEGEESNTER